MWHVRADGRHHSALNDRRLLSPVFFMRGAFTFRTARVLLCSALTSLVGANALANDSGLSAHSGGQIRAEVIVESTRLPQRIDAAPWAVAVVDKAQIQLAQPQLGLDESLVRVPGLFLQNRYNYAQDLRIAMRGFGARAEFGIRGIKVLVDGIPATLPDGQGSVDAIDLASVESIEVLRGPSSVRYGNAAGGIIVVTSELPAQRMLDARLASGADGYRKNQFKWGNSGERIDYAVSLSDLRIDGYRDHSEAENRQLNSRLRLRLRNDATLDALFNVTDQPTANDPGGVNAAQAADAPRSARDRNIALDAGETLRQYKTGWLFRQPLGSGELLLRSYYGDRDFDALLPIKGRGAIDLQRQFGGAGIAWHDERELTNTLRHRYALGIDIDAQDDKRKRYDNINGQRGNLRLAQDEKVDSVGVYAHSQTAWADSVLLDLGLRYDELRFDVDDDFRIDGNQSGQRNFYAVSPSVGVSLRASDTLHIYTNISTSFETPTTTEFSNPNGGGFNPALREQTARSAELGLRYSNEYIQANLAAFRIDLDDELVPYDVDGDTFFANSGKSHREGVELSAGLPITDDLQASLAYTYMTAQFDDFIDDGVSLAGKRIPGLPEHVAHIAFDYRYSVALAATLEALYVDRFDLNNANTAATDAYLVTNLRAAYTFIHREWAVEPFVSISNVFDQRYTANGRINAFGGRYFEPGPERSLHAGFRLFYH